MTASNRSKLQAAGALEGALPADGDTPSRDLLHRLANSFTRFALGLIQPRHR
ncbi:MAG: hypothetical protein U0Q16_05475 [Bryobacteraceae bacterium]